MNNINVRDPACTDTRAQGNDRATATANGDGLELSENRRSPVMVQSEKTEQDPTDHSGSAIMPVDDSDSVSDQGLRAASPEIHSSSVLGASNKVTAALNHSSSEVVLDAGLGRPADVGLYEDGVPHVTENTLNAGPDPLLSEQGPDLIDLPTDRPRPVKDSVDRALWPIRFKNPLVQQLKIFAIEHSVDLQVVLLSAWSAVLARLSGQSKLNIALQGLAAKFDVGKLDAFVYSSIHVDLSAEPSAERLLQQVKRAIMELAAPQFTLRKDTVTRYQVSFCLHIQGIDDLEQSSPGTTPAGSELELNLQYEDEQIVGAMHFSASLFDPSTVERHVGYLQSMLEGMMSNPTQSFAKINIISSDERLLLLDTWNNAPIYDQEFPTIHRLFEEQVKRTPEAIALVHENVKLTYEELNVRSNSLAHRLLELGVRPDTCVAICVGQSIAMVVGILATLKAGGAYVPLDPAYPSERLMSIIDDAAPSIMVADETGRTAVSEAALCSITIVNPNTPSNHQTVDPQVPGLTSRHLAYVLYTSGSTGKPKGVMIEHRGVANIIQYHSELYVIREHRRSLQLASFSFDASVWEIFMAISSGLTLYLAPESCRMDRDKLWEYVILHSITFVTCTPSFLQDGKNLPIPNKPLTLGYSTTTDNYGPTEASISATAWRCPTDYDKTIVPIGRSKRNVQLYVLDSHQQLAPMGAIGELYIGGVGVARGYLNKARQTAERFLLDPFCDHNGARMYRTGDLARYLPDGNLVYLGRTDDQVKIRGFRIELGEIEAGLLAHEWVSQAAVLALGSDDQQQLVAYVVSETQDNLPYHLRSHLAARLPHYMVPAAYVRLDALPRTANHKLDRKALPVPDEDDLARAAYEAPQGDIENKLADIWTQLLQIKSIGRHDNFFALGGHSLLAVRLMNRIATLGVNIPLSCLFASSTLSAFAAVVSEHLTLGLDSLPNIVPVARDSALLLSFAQQRLWFLAQMEGVSETYHIPTAVRLHGEFNKTAWQQALDELYTRHEALRSVFINIDGRPQVQILKANGMPLRYYDLHSSMDRELELKHIAEEEAYTSFNLEQGSLIRAAVVRLDDKEHVLIITMHHIVSDGWSSGIMLSELSQLYTVYCKGEPSPLPSLAIQYPDYAAWQRQWLSSERLQIQSEYWRTALSHAPVLIDLPTDRPRPLLQSFDGGHVSVTLDAQLTRALKKLSQKHGVTLFMTLLSAWSIVLSRLSGQNDIVIGTPSANRGQREIESLIGFFANTLAMRVDLSGDPNTRELLERVRRNTLDAYAHQDMPFEQVVEIVQPPRRMDHTPLFQVMFVWQNNEEGKWNLPGLQVTPYEVGYNSARFDLTLSLWESDGGIGGGIEYATSLFDQSTIERYIGYLQVVLQTMVSDADKSLANIEILSSAERTFLLRTWNDTQQDYPDDHVCLHHLFEQQVERTPEAIALIHEETSLTYAELNIRANRLAHCLLALGVQPDTPIAICVQRSPAMIIGVLAILKAGGAYVPLDPAYPSERLFTILSDSSPTIMLADETGTAVLGEHCLSSFNTIDPNVVPSSVMTVPNPQVPGLTSRHLAYIIYTSGSTGKPKGVMVEHRMIVRAFDAISSWFRFNEDDAWSMFHSLAFDISVWEMWGALKYGGKLILVPQHITRSPEDFYRLLSEQGVTVLNQTPSAFSLLINYQEHTSAIDSLRYVILAGEALAPAMLQPWYAIHSESSPQIVNMYGPTETFYATFRPMNQEDCSLAYSPIGVRFPDLKFYVLDRHGRPVPIGAIGELYIGGAGVARGYWDRPDLTAERFLPDPFGGNEIARMYKTGDLVRYLPDSNLIFIGRSDDQIKIRGFRIELGEIEARLTEHPLVSEAVVIALGEENQKRLVAYFVAQRHVQHEQGVNAIQFQLASTLRSHLITRLPEYMVPAAFVHLEAFPLTSNGKLDRRALPSPGDADYPRQLYEEPRGEIENILSSIWKELLNVERVGRSDGFFILGGHSLMAVRMIDRIRTTLGFEMSLRTLFESPTLAELAPRLLATGTTQEGSYDVLLPIKPRGTRPPLFCIHPGTGLSWCYAGLSTHLDPDQPLYGLQARGFIGDRRTSTTLDDMVLDYIDQIRRIQPQGPYHLLGYSFGGLVAHTMASYLEKQGDHVALIALMDTPADCHSREQRASDEDKDEDKDEAEMLRNLIAMLVGNNDQYSPELANPFLNRMPVICENNSRIARAQEPHVISGDLFVFRATVLGKKAEKLWSPEDWKPYVLGRIEVCDIECEHDYMDLPEPTAIIGQVLNQKLKELRGLCHEEQTV